MFVDHIICGVVYTKGFCFPSRLTGTELLVLCRDGVHDAGRFRFDLQRIRFKMRSVRMGNTQIRNKNNNACTNIDSPLVLVEIVFAREQLLAELAAEHLFAGVRDDVPHQMLLATERLVAAFLVALERTQTQMQFQMLRQVLLAFEHLAAHAARWRCVFAGGGIAVDATRQQSRRQGGGILRLGNNFWNGAHFGRCRIAG